MSDAFVFLLHAQNKEQYEHDLAWLTPKVDTAQDRAAEIEGMVEQMDLKLSLLASSNKRAGEDIQDLKACRALWRVGEGEREMYPGKSRERGTETRQSSPQPCLIPVIGQML